MSGVVTWIKSNLLIVICAVVSTLSIVSLLVWPTASGGNDLVASIKKKSGPMPNRLKAYLNTQFDIPPVGLDDVPMRKTWPISQAVIDRLQSIFKDRDAEYKLFAKMILDRNNPYIEGSTTARKHTVFAPGVLPKVTSQDQLFSAKSSYLDAVEKLHARLNTAKIPTSDAIAKLSEQVEIDWRAANSVPEKLDVKLQNRLNREIARKIMDLIRKNAQGHAVYAPTDLIKKMAWALESERRATPLHVYQGQVQLWILRDLIDTILLANQPQAGGEPSLITGPVKHLQSMHVERIFVGVNTKDFGAGPDHTSSVLPNRFDLGPTGRSSNSLYDVHTAQITAIVDMKQLPKLINSFRKVNFMTVTSVQTSPANPYANFKAGYFYGDNQHLAVAKIQVETIWFRAWTAGHNSKEDAERAGEKFVNGYMPDTIRAYLGLPPRDPEFKQGENPAGIELGTQ